MVLLAQLAQTQGVGGGGVTSPFVVGTSSASSSQGVCSGKTMTGGTVAVESRDGSKSKIVAPSGRLGTDGTVTDGIKGRVVCNKCKSNSHLTKECRLGHCVICGKESHITDDCTWLKQIKPTPKYVGFAAE